MYWQGTHWCLGNGRVDMQAKAERPQSISLLKHFKTDLPEGVKGIGSPDVRAQHVKGALLVAILGGRERQLLARRHKVLSKP